MTAQIAELGLYGIAPDLPEQEQADHYTSVRNMLPRDVMERVRNQVQVLGTPLFAPQWLLQSRDDADAVTWFYAGEDGIGKVAGTLHEDITPLEWSGFVTANPYTGGVLNSVPVINGNLPYYWPGAGPCQVLPDWPVTDRALSMRPYAFHLVACGVVAGGTLLEDEVRWSSRAEPGTIPASWTPQPDNDAGFLQCGDTRGAIVDAAPYRDALHIFKEQSTYALQFVGGATVMVKRLLSPSVGVLSRNCVANISGVQAILTDGDVVVTDGNQFRSIATRAVRRSIFANANAARLGWSFMVGNERHGELLVCVPGAGQQYPSVAWVYSFDRGRWGQRDLSPAAAHALQGAFRFTEGAETWNTIAGPWSSATESWSEFEVVDVDFDEIVTAEPVASRFSALDVFTAEPRADLESNVVRRGIVINREQLTSVRRVWLDVSGDAGTTLEVTLQGYDNLGSAPITQPTVMSSSVGEFVVGTDTKVDVLATGRYFILTVANRAQAGRPWAISRIRLEYRPRGINQ